MEEWEMLELDEALHDAYERVDQVRKKARRHGLMLPSMGQTLNELDALCSEVLQAIEYRQAQLAGKADTE